MTSGPVSLAGTWKLDVSRSRAGLPPFSALHTYGADGSPQLTLTFFVDDQLDRAENFDSLDIALFRSEDVKKTLISDGWKNDE